VFARQVERLAAIPPDVASTIEITTPPARRSTAAIKPVFVVRAIDRVCDAKPSATLPRSKAMFRFNLASFVAILLAFADVGRSQTAALDPAAIQAAIDFGISKEPQPYLLRHAQGEGTNDVVVAAVYTPFLRVASAARAVWDDGNGLMPEEVPAWLTAPTDQDGSSVYVVPDIERHLTA
jgi:hypothetical protein